MTQEVWQWTNPSVMVLAEGDDPFASMQFKVKTAILEAAERGWTGPPYDPFQLADLMNIGVTPNDEVFDARTVPVGPDGFRIEFNPNRPHGRMRYSIAHEIAHTLFPDCGESVRNRLRPSWFREDEWQLELLCNVGAAEILMPTRYGSLEDEDVDINNLVRLRQQFDVSMEALLLRIAKLTNTACAVFAAARVESDDQPAGYRIDYSVPSRSWSAEGSLSNFRISESAVLQECTAVGFTAKGTENWGSTLPEFNIECVGIPPFPGSRFPRVVGVLTSDTQRKSPPMQIRHLFGDALVPRGDDPRMIAHIVNDGTANWGGRGFAQAVSRRWLHVQEDFRNWVESDRRHLTLGNVRWAHVEGELSIVHMIAQQGYGRSESARIRYAALDSALKHLADLALGQGASVHMPRIGTGQARGSWELIQELIDERLVRRGVPVTVYTLPESVPVELQGKLNL
ncbi:MAG: ImmA/IrrE family metallo-endopeptidase [Chloroflexi bacterium]|nr:ImmA/IrrE family metallo-endopeptidase [Chloroflexota bacterium]